MHSIRKTFRPIDCKSRGSAYWMLLPPIVASAFFFPTAGMRALAVVVPFGCLWIVIAVFAFYTERWARTFRVRLLPDGVRLTRWNRTFNFSEPTIVNPQRLASHRWITLQSGNQKMHLPLPRFTRREQAILIEHCSQFLTPEQQLKCGPLWSRHYSALITAHKPKPIDLLSTWNSVATCVVIGIFALPLLIESLRSGFAVREWWMLPEIRSFYLWSLTGLVICAPVIVAVLWLLDRLVRRFPRQCC